MRRAKRAPPPAACLLPPKRFRRKEASSESRWKNFLRRYAPLDGGAELQKKPVAAGRKSAHTLGYPREGSDDLPPALRQRIGHLYLSPREPSRGRGADHRSSAGKGRALLAASCRA